MKIALLAEDESLRQTLLSWGWEIASELHDPGIDAIVSGGSLLSHAPVPVVLVTELHTAAPPGFDDFCVPPLRKAELAARILASQARRDHFAKVMHDLRSPLNALQGYAELIAESAKDENLRYAAQLRVAVGQLTDYVKRLRAEGV
jgi:signal transduction histidine kinase